MTVCVVDDDPDFRESLLWLLGGAGHQALGFASGAAFLAAWEAGELDPESIGPCVVLLDIRMPGMSGLALQQQLRERGAQLPIIVITGHGDVPTAVEAMKNAAVDFLEKPFDDSQLLQLVATVLSRAEQSQAAAGQAQRQRQRWAGLSPRELEVARCVIAGQRNRQIAEGLGISIKTVEAHRSRVMRKLELDNVQALVALAAEVEGPGGALRDAGEEDR